MSDIKITFRKDGTRKLEAFGMVGPACEQRTKFLEGVLGTVTSNVKKAEWFIDNSENLRYLEGLGMDGSNHCG